MPIGASRNRSPTSVQRGAAAGTGADSGAGAAAAARLRTGCGEVLAARRGVNHQAVCSFGKGRTAATISSPGTTAKVSSRARAFGGVARQAVEHRGTGSPASASSGGGGASPSPHARHAAIDGLQSSTAPSFAGDGPGDVGAARRLPRRAAHPGVARLLRGQTA